MLNLSPEKPTIVDDNSFGAKYFQPEGQSASNVQSMMEGMKKILETLVEKVDPSSIDELKEKLPNEVQAVAADLEACFLLKPQLTLAHLKPALTQSLVAVYDLHPEVKPFVVIIQGSSEQVAIFRTNSNGEMEETIFSPIPATL